MEYLDPFLNQYSNTQTRQGYLSGVISFLSFIYDSPREKRRVTPEEKAGYETLGFDTYQGLHPRDLRVAGD